MHIIEASVDFDLEDFEEEIKQEYCNGGNCLGERVSLKVALKEYVKRMYKELYIFPEKNRKLKTYEEIYDDLCYLLCEYI